MLYVICLLYSQICVILSRNASVFMFRLGLITNASASNYIVTAAECKNNSGLP